MSKQHDWAGEVAAWRASGLAARQFCEGREYTTTRLYWWSSQLKRAERAKDKKSIPLARVVRSRDVDRARLAGAPIVVQIGHARVEVTAGADRAALSMVLDALAVTAWSARP